jgi:hypothetical protein
MLGSSPESSFFGVIPAQAGIQRLFTANDAGFRLALRAAGMTAFGVIPAVFHDRRQGFRGDSA